MAVVAVEGAQDARYPLQHGFARYTSFHDVRPATASTSWFVMLAGFPLSGNDVHPGSLREASCRKAEGELMIPHLL
ncbi:hypothetical protein Kisp02_14960 [Kineosporia sp. NBRC 101731]|nr:hypothetical protein Kisp02_14960 [Kineosporia sp. NBRC 101731]